VEEGSQGVDSWLACSDTLVLLDEPPVLVLHCKNEKRIQTSAAEHISSRASMLLAELDHTVAMVLHPTCPSYVVRWFEEELMSKLVDGVR